MPMILGTGWDNEQTSFHSVSHILFRSEPFKIRNTIIQFVTIFVIREVVRRRPRRSENLQYQLVDGPTRPLVVPIQINICIFLKLRLENSALFT